MSEFRWEKHLPWYSTTEASLNRPLDFDLNRRLARPWYPRRTTRHTLCPFLLV